MAQISLFYDAVIGVEGKPDRAYSSADFAMFFSNLYQNGVVMPVREAFQIKPASTGGMRVVVSAGAANINGYQFINTEDFALEVAVASASQSRTDSIGIQHNLGERETKIYYKQGDISVTRQEDVWELQLAQINVIRNAVEITAANITDKRPDGTVCGYASPYMDIPVSGLEQQYQSMLQAVFEEFEGKAQQNQTDLETLLSGQQTMFNEWFAALQNQLDDNQAANLQNQIFKLTPDKQIFEINHGLKSYPQVMVTAWEGGLGTVGIGEPNWTGSVPETIPAKIGYPSWNEIQVSVPVDHQMINPVIVETEPNSWLLAEGMKSMRIRILGGI